MKFKTLLAVHAVIAFIAGISFILAPAQLLSSYGVSLIPMGTVIYQFWGAALVGLGMLSWFARNIKESPLQKSIALSLIITHVINCVLAIRGQFLGANEFGWSTVALFFLIVVGFGSFLIIKPKN